MMTDHSERTKMKRSSETHGKLVSAALAASLGLAAILATGSSPSSGVEALEARSFVVQAADAGAAAAAVAAAGGTVTHELGIIDAVAADLTAAQLKALRQAARVQAIHANHGVQTAGDEEPPAEEPGESSDVLSDYGSGNDDWSNDAYANSPYTYYPERIGADHLHEDGFTGLGVTIAFLDTGIFGEPPLSEDTSGDLRVLAQYDSTSNRTRKPTTWADKNGHGSHVISTAVNSEANADDGRINGVAPDAQVVLVRAFDRNGIGTYADVIRGIDWVIANKDLYGIRVLNLSFSAPPRSAYWDDPLNQAVMRAWEAGIVVVASAGNGGPDPMTIGVPGNVPYVITVGAMTDSYTAYDRQRRPAGQLLRRGTDRRGLRQARPDRPRRPYPRPDALELRRSPSRPSRLPRRRPLLHDVRHLAGGRRGQRPRRPGAAGRSLADAGRGQVPADGVGAAGRGPRGPVWPTASSSRAPAWWTPCGRSRPTPPAAPTAAWTSTPTWRAQRTSWAAPGRTTTVTTTWWGWTTTRLGRHYRRLHLE